MKGHKKPPQKVLKIFPISVGLSFPDLETNQKCSIGTSCTVKCEVTAGDRPDIDWLTRDGIINFYSGSQIGFSGEKSQVVAQHHSQFTVEVSKFSFSDLKCSV